MSAPSNIDFTSPEGQSLARQFTSSFGNPYASPNQHSGSSSLTNSQWIVVQPGEVEQARSQMVDPNQLLPVKDNQGNVQYYIRSDKNIKPEFQHSSHSSGWDTIGPIAGIAGAALGFPELMSAFPELFAGAEGVGAGLGAEGAIGAEGLGAGTLPAMEGPGAFDSLDSILEQTPIDNYSTMNFPFSPEASQPGAFDSLEGGVNPYPGDAEVPTEGASSRPGMDPLSRLISGLPSAAGALRTAVPKPATPAPSVPTTSAGTSGSGTMGGMRAGVDKALQNPYAMAQQKLVGTLQQYLRGR